MLDKKVVQRNSDLAYTLPQEVLESIIKRVHLHLVDFIATNYINKNVSLKSFYDLNEDLYKNEKSKRQPKYKRKRILIITSSLVNKKIAEEACLMVNDKFKRYGEIFSVKRIDMLTLKAKDNLLEKLEGYCEYSDVILLTKEKRGNSQPVIDLCKNLKMYPYIYPNVIEDIHKECSAEALAEDFEKTIYFALRTNDDKYSDVWKTYAVIDNLYYLLNSRILTANRLGEMDEIYRRYGIIKKPNELPYFEDSKVLVWGDSAVSPDDLKKIIKDKNMNPDNFEFCLDYGSTSFDLDKLKGNVKYKAVCLGPQPHKMINGGKNGLIGTIQNNSDLYPKLIVIRNNAGELKITKRAFEKALDEIDF